MWQEKGSGIPLQMELTEQNSRSNLTKPQRKYNMGPFKKCYTYFKITLLNILWKYVSILNKNILFLCLKKLIVKLMSTKVFATLSTYFKSQNGTLIDLMLTDRQRSFLKSQNVEIDLSDCHKLVVSIQRASFKNLPGKSITC